MEVMGRIISTVLLSLILTGGFIHINGCAGGDSATVTINVGIENVARAHTPTVFDRFLALISMSSTLRAAPPNPQLGLTSLEITVSGVGMASIKQSIPMETGQLTLDVPSGPARTFTVVAYSEDLPAYGGIAVKTLSPGASETIPIQMGLLPPPPEQMNLNAGWNDPTGVELGWSYSFSEPPGLIGFRIYRSDNLEPGPYYVISSGTKERYYNGETYTYIDLNGIHGDPDIDASWYKISAVNQYGEGYLSQAFANEW